LARGFARRLRANPKPAVQTAPIADADWAEGAGGGGFGDPEDDIPFVSCECAIVVPRVRRWERW
jgi:hypothetical protein